MPTSGRRWRSATGAISSPRCSTSNSPRSATGPSATASPMPPIRNSPAIPRCGLIRGHVDDVNARFARSRHGGRADPAVPHPAEGARRRRRRIDAHAKGSPRVHRRALCAAGRRALRRRPEASISAEITYEDGRKGKLAGTCKIDDMASIAAADAEPRGMSERRETRYCFRSRTSRCRSAACARSPTFRSTFAKGEIRAIIGPNGAGKTSMLNVINGFYHPQIGRILFQGQTRSRMRPYEAARQGIARTFQNVALFKGMTALDNIMTGRNLRMKRACSGRRCATARRSTKRSATAGSARRSSTFSRSRQSARRRSARCPTACKSVSNSGARSRWSRRCCCSTSRWPA